MAGCTVDAKGLSLFISVQVYSYFYTLKIVGEAKRDVSFGCKVSCCPPLERLMVGSYLDVKECYFHRYMLTNF